MYFESMARVPFILLLEVCLYRKNVLWGTSRYWRCVSVEKMSGRIRKSIQVNFHLYQAHDFMLLGIWATLFYV